eukprot:tig00000670_g3034.t1
MMFVAIQAALPRAAEAAPATRCPATCEVSGASSSVRQAHAAKPRFLASSFTPIFEAGRRSRAYTASAPAIQRFVTRAEGGSSSEGEQEEPISKALRRSFLEACLPGQRPYVDALQEFIAKGVEAYKRGYNLRALDLELSLAQDDASGLNYSLAQDEQDMRTVWLSLIFLTAAKVGVSRPSEAVPPSDELKLSHFVDMVIAAFQKGYDLKRLQLEQRFASSGGIFGAAAGPAADAPSGSSAEAQAQKNVESAIVSQSMRIVFMTLESIFGRPAGGGAAPA